MVGLTVFFFVSHLILERTSVRMPWVKDLQNPYYIVYALASGIGSIWCTGLLFTHGVFDSISNTYCTCLPLDSFGNLLQLYYLSKLLDFTDIIGCILRGVPLHIHFRIHHCTTLALAYTFLRYPSSHGGLFMAANMFMHLFVYPRESYSFFRTFSFIWWTCRIWGHVQLILGAVASLASLVSALKGTPCPCGVVEADAFDLFIYVLYFCLYQKQIWDYRHPPSHQKKKE